MMYKKILTTKSTPRGMDVTLLLLRVGASILMIPHGWDKLMHFKSYSNTFYSLWGLPPMLCLGLVIFAELFCSFALLLGLFTRLAAIPLVFTMFVAAFLVHIADGWGEMEHALLYFSIYLPISVFGAGKWSFDKLIFG